MYCSKDPTRCRQALSSARLRERCVTLFNVSTIIVFMATVCKGAGRSGGGGRPPVHRHCPAVLVKEVPPYPNVRNAWVSTTVRTYPETPSH